MTKTLLTTSLTRRAGLAALAGAAALASVAGLGATAAFAADKTSVKVGIMSGEDEDVWRAAAAEAEKVGLTLELVTFNDYTQPNEALERGEIDANAFQHKPYLDNQIAQNGYHIVIAEVLRSYGDGGIAHPLADFRQPLRSRDAALNP